MLPALSEYRKMGSIETIQLKRRGDERGALTAIEANKTIPFPIERVYYIYDTELNVSRGFHAHRHLQQMVVCLQGQCRFVVDDGNSRQEVMLNSPETGLLLKGLIWREMHDFTPDCVLLVLADKHYDEADYIRDYQDFLQAVCK